jgi:hypothetical protein
MPERKGNEMKKKAKIIVYTEREKKNTKIEL